MESDNAMVEQDHKLKRSTLFKKEWPSHTASHDNARYAAITMFLLGVIESSLPDFEQFLVPTLYTMDFRGYGLVSPHSLIMLFLLMLAFAFLIIFMYH